MDPFSGISFSHVLPIGREKGSESIMNAKRFLKALWVDDRGQSTTEYILILSVVVMVALKFKSTFQKQLTNLTTALDGKISNAMNEDGLN